MVHLKNLSKNTTDAYMSDLKVYLQWLRSNEYSLLDADREIINNYLAFKLDKRFISKHDSENY